MIRGGAADTYGMPPDLAGVGATSRPLPSSPIGPTGSPGPVPSGGVRPVTPSTAVVPTGPLSGPLSVRGAVASSPLGRSGLDLVDVLETTDVLLARRVVAPVELEVGLETARGTLLRGLAAESLSTLDGVWARAQFTEEGWYLRSGALAVLGLPGEAERVSSEALERQPSSVALRFVQSLARLASGDVSGARSALAVAIDQQATHPVLLMQQAIVLARQGRPREAERVLQQVAQLVPEHPAVEVARTTLQAIAADHTRSRSRDVSLVPMHEPSRFPAGDHEPFEAVDLVDHVDGATPHDARSATPSSSHGGVIDDGTGNVAARAIARLSARVAVLSVAEAQREGRMLIRAFSAGGAMAGACTPDQAHAARAVLTAIIAALNGGAPAWPASPLDMLLAQWIPLMQADRVHDAARVLRRVGGGIPEAQRRLLAACVRMPSEPSTRDDREPRVMSVGVGAFDTPVLGEPVTGPLLAVRLGLALLEERALDRPRAWTPDTGAPAHVTPGGGSVGVIGAAADTDGRGWGTVLAASASQPAPRAEGPAMRLVALLCVVIAAGAATSGAGVVALVFGGGAIWLGLRGGGRSGGPLPGADDRDTTGAD